MTDRLGCLQSWFSSPTRGVESLSKKWAFPLVERPSVFKVSVATEPAQIGRQDAPVGGEE